MATIKIGKKNTTVSTPDPDELKLLQTDLPTITSVYSKYAPDGISAISKIIMEDYATYGVALGLAKDKISDAGAFGGALPDDGFGITQIRPDFLVPAAQGRTFYKSVSGLTPNGWYGLWHNGAIGDAYNDNPLYLRKEVLVAISGLLDVSGSGIIEEVQFEINSDKRQIVPMGPQIKGTDFRLVRFPTPVIIPSSTQFRSQAKFTAASGDVELIPIGIAFATSEFMKNTTPTQPTTTKP